MGRVKELIIELAETFEDLRPSRGTWHAAIDAMKEILSPDEFEFFLDHIDDVKTIIGMHDKAYPTNEARGGKQLWLKIPEYDADDFAEVLNDNGIHHESQYLDSMYGGDYSTYFFFDNEEDFRNAKDIQREFLKESLSEAHGVKGDVLRPYGGRKARANMGYGRGNRAGYNPEEDDEYYDQYELGPGDGAITNLVRRNETEWPEEMRDEEFYDEDDDVPYPGGMTQDDYDLDVDRDPDEDIYPANESLLMPSLNEYWDDEKESQRQWDAAEYDRRRFKEREQTAGEYSDEDERDFVRSQKGLYVKVGKMYMPALYHTPDIGRTDGKLYRKNNKTGGYFPVKG